MSKMKEPTIWTIKECFPWQSETTRLEAAQLEWDAEANTVKITSNNSVILSRDVTSGTDHFEFERSCEGSYKEFRGYAKVHRSSADCDDILFGVIGYKNDGQTDDDDTEVFVATAPPRA